METVRIEILNPKAMQLLKNLADLNLIAITEKKTGGFMEADEKTWLKAMAGNPAFDFLHDEKEDIYKITDGEPYQQKLTS